MKFDYTSAFFILSLNLAQELVSLREFSDCERELWRQDRENSEDHNTKIAEMKSNVIHHYYGS